MKEIIKEGFKEIYPDEGKLLILNNEIIDYLVLPINMDIDFLENFTEINDASYVPPEPLPSEEHKLTQLQENQIKMSKVNLASYLEGNPLPSNVKHPEGRLYNVTSEKQQQLTAKVLMATMYQTIGIPYLLTWNDTGNECEEWQIEELQMLSMQIDAYVTPLVALQQRMEVQIKNATNQQEVLEVNIDFTEDVINEWRKGYEQTH